MPSISERFGQTVCVSGEVRESARSIRIKLAEFSHISTHGEVSPITAGSITVSMINNLEEGVIASARCFRISMHLSSAQS